MKTISKYIVLFVWVVIFMYFYDMFMSKGLLYFIIGIPMLFLSVVVISKIFDKSKNTKK